MEKSVEHSSINLIFWQILLIVLIIAAVYFIVKLYKKTMKYLDRK